MTRYQTPLTAKSSAFAMLASVAMCFGTMVAIMPTHAEAATPQASPEAMTAKLSYAGYDLTNPRDAARLARQIRSAANKVCGGQNGRVDLATSSAIQSCETRAVAEAASKVNSPRVSALLNIKTDNIKVAVR